MKKVALCLHGYFDSFTDLSSKGEDGFEHIKHHILDKADVDVFIHTWDKENKEQIDDLYGYWTRSLVVEDQVNFEEEQGEYKSPEGHSPPKTIFSHLYSIQESFKACYDVGEKYDCVIKSRFDLGRINRRSSGPHNLQNPYPVQCINFNPDNPMSYFYMADWQYLESDGPADMWFYSNQKNMLEFTHIYDYLVAAAPTVEEWNAIKIYKSFLITHGLWEKSRTLPTTWE